MKERKAESHNSWQEVINGTYYFSQCQDWWLFLESVSERKVHISAVQVLVETLWPSSLAASQHTCTSTAHQERYRTRPRAATIPAEPSVAQVTSQKPSHKAAPISHIETSKKKSLIKTGNEELHRKLVVWYTKLIYILCVIQQSDCNLDNQRHIWECFRSYQDTIHTHKTQYGWLCYPW